jgi:hypothetical protein
MCMILKTAVATLLIGAGVTHAAGPAHVHGVARLDVAIEATRVTVQMEMPLENLLGYERAPRSDAERRQADAAVARLRAVSAMFVIDPAAQCKPATVELESAALKLGSPEAKGRQRRSQGRASRPRGRRWQLRVHLCRCHQGGLHRCRLVRVCALATARGAGGRAARPVQARAQAAPSPHRPCTMKAADDRGA